LYHVEDLGEGIFEDEELLQLRRGSREVGEQYKAFVANRVSRVVEGRNQP
jgi:hypothetical protein